MLSNEGRARRRGRELRTKHERKKGGEKNGVKTTIKESKIPVFTCLISHFFFLSFIDFTAFLGIDPSFISLLILTGISSHTFVCYSRSYKQLEKRETFELYQVFLYSKKKRLCFWPCVQNLSKYELPYHGGNCVEYGWTPDVDLYLNLY